MSILLVGGLESGSNINQRRHTIVHIFYWSLAILVLPWWPQGIPGLNVRPLPLQVSLPVAFQRWDSHGFIKVKMWSGHNRWRWEVAGPVVAAHVCVLECCLDCLLRAWLENVISKDQVSLATFKSVHPSQALGKSRLELVPKAWTLSGFSPSLKSCSLCLSLLF